MIKKHIRKLKFIFLFSLVFLLSACEIKGTDTINVDKNFKGNRTTEKLFILYMTKARFQI